MLVSILKRLVSFVVTEAPGGSVKSQHKEKDGTTWILS